jgi:hypothetical protein
VIKWTSMRHLCDEVGAMKHLCDEVCLMRHLHHRLVPYESFI